VKNNWRLLREFGFRTLEHHFKILLLPLNNFLLILAQVGRNVINATGHWLIFSFLQIFPDESVVSLKVVLNLIHLHSVHRLREHKP
jgi:hypothetical protein